MKFPEITIRLPDWTEAFLKKSPENFVDIKDRMRFVIELARSNIQNGSGGPFAAAVFDETGRLIAPGVNTVFSSGCSIFHAEIVALAVAQKIMGTYDLSAGGSRCFELFTSAEPCAMCFGAIPWSGIHNLVCGARDEDVRAIGFDEGPKLSNWINALNERGISVLTDVLRDDAVKVLKEYTAMGGIIYNAGLP